MKQPYTFHKTVRGHNHVLRNIPCEDSSASLSSEDGRFHIAVVADGHGADECFRSATGSKLAVEVTLKCLKDFAESILFAPESEVEFSREILSDPRYRQVTMQRLTDTIIANWTDEVEEDYKKRPPKKEEIPEDLDEAKLSENISHIYGTTLIAALLLPGCLILVQQGDGRCEIFYEDGTIEQPIPWDERCEDNVTTSLCDSDVRIRIRTFVVDLSERNVIACYMGSDGVEDAYRDTYEDFGKTHTVMGGVHTFYKNLSLKLVTQQQGEFSAYLEEMLPKFSEQGLFSKSGSGDDVSVAGIVDIPSLQKHKEGFQKDIELYALEENLFWKEDALKGKERKHGILQRRVQDTKEKLDKLKQELSLLDSEITKLESEKKEVEEACGKKQREQNESLIMLKVSTEQEKSTEADWKIGTLKRLERLVRQNVDNSNKLAEIHAKITEQRQREDRLKKQIDEEKDKFSAVQKEFDAYDAECKKIVNERSEILQRIDEINKL